MRNSNLENALNDLTQMAEEQKNAAEEARKAKEEAERIEKKATEAGTKIEEARRATEAAKQAVEEIDVDNPNANSKEHTNNNTINGNGWRIVGPIALAVAVLAAGYIIVKESKNAKVVNNNTRVSNDIHSISNDAEVNTDKQTINYDAQNNEVTVAVNEPLTNEKFEEITTNFTKVVTDNNLPVSTVDTIKFVSIANIDEISENNPELIQELAGSQTKEEYLNDAAKVIGAAVMHNISNWQNTKSTKNFIRVSDTIYGSQKDNMLKIESYTDKIANAANNEDADLVNSLVSELLTELNSGSLSKLDDGVGFAAQINLATIYNGIARNYLNQENRNMLEVLSTSEKYVSNIFVEYEGCTLTSQKTLTK